jgi:hypothetical protein
MELPQNAAVAGRRSELAFVISECRNRCVGLLQGWEARDGP